MRSRMGARQMHLMGHCRKVSLNSLSKNLPVASVPPWIKPYEQANDLFEEGDISNATSIFNQVLEADGLNVDAHAGHSKMSHGSG